MRHTHFQKLTARTFEARLRIKINHCGPGVEERGSESLDSKCSFGHRQKLCAHILAPDCSEKLPSAAT